MTNLWRFVASVCFCTVAIRCGTTAVGDELPSAEGGGATPSTRFFKTHPNEIDLAERDGAILFANRQVGLEFRKSAGGLQLSRLYGIADDQDFLTPAPPAKPRDLFEIRMTLDPKFVGKDERWNIRPGLFGIMDEMAGDAFGIGSHAAKAVSWRREGTASESVLRLEWKGTDVREDKDAQDVEVTIALRAGDPLSYWRISVRNRSTRYGIERVRFPLLNLAPIGKAEDDVFLLPQYRGEALENPFRQRNIHAYYPFNFNMQFQALYDKRSGKGIYLGTRDPAPV